MGWTKQQLITEAYAELALADYVFDITPDEQQTALRRLDTMMATWEAKGIRLGYPFPSSPDDSNLDQASGLPDAAIETVYLNLAIRLAPGNGKQPSADTRRNAKEGFDTLLWAAAQPIRMQLPNTLPRGAGNKHWGLQQPFFNTPDSERLVSNDPGSITLLE